MQSACFTAGANNDQVAPALLGKIDDRLSRWTVLQYNLPKTSHVRMRVYDLRGRCIWELEEHGMREGEHAVVWHGRDRWGKRISSGVYYLHLEATGADKSSINYNEIAMWRIIVLH